MSTKAAPVRPSSAVLLTLDDVCNELAVEPLVVRRLYARGKLTATPLSHPLDLRFTRDAFQSYIETGAPDLTAPAVDGRWFVGPPRDEAVRFVGKVRTAAQPQRISEDALRARVKSEGGREFTVGVQATAPIKAVFEQRPPKPLIRIAGADSTPTFELLADVYFVFLLRQAAQRAVDNAVRLMDNRLVKLYESPTLYAGFVAAAVNAVAAETIEWSEVLSLDARHSNLTVRYVFPLAPFATRQRLAKLATDKAF